ncbi:MAG: hypothetical protein ABI042_00280 [Verrucomicrobiota bacterium]
MRLTNEKLAVVGQAENKVKTESYYGGKSDTGISRRGKIIFTI